MTTRPWMDSGSKGRSEHTVGTKETSFRHAAAAGAGLILTMILTACSGGSGAEGTPGSNQTQQPATSQVSSGPEIANPKNATAMDVCSLLPGKAAGTLGVQSDGEKDSNDLKSSLPDACVWESPGSGATKISLTAIDDRSIQEYYDNSAQYADFKKLTIADYPAVRANKNDPMVGGSCYVFLASKRNQVVMSSARLNAKDTGKVDPCDMAKKALKLSVSSWPAA